MAVPVALRRARLAGIGLFFLTGLALAIWIVNIPAVRASTSVLLAASPTVTGVTGRYFEDNHIADRADNPDEAHSGVADHSIDPELAEQLWTLTRQMLDL